MLLHGVEFQEGSEVEDLTFKKTKLQVQQFMCHWGNKKLTAKKQLYAAVLGVKIFNKIPVFPVKGQMLSIQGPTNF